MRDGSRADSVGIKAGSLYNGTFTGQIARRLALQSSRSVDHARGAASRAAVRRTRGGGVRHALETGTFAGARCSRLPRRLPRAGEITTCEVDPEARRRRRHSRRACTRCSAGRLARHRGSRRPFDDVYIEALQGRCVELRPCRSRSWHVHDVTAVITRSRSARMCTFVDTWYRAKTGRSRSPRSTTCTPPSSVCDGVTADGAAGSGLRQQPLVRRVVERLLDDAGRAAARRAARPRAPCRRSVLDGQVGERDRLPRRCARSRPTRRRRSGRPASRDGLVAVQSVSSASTTRQASSPLGTPASRRAAAPRGR